MTAKAPTKVRYAHALMEMRPVTEGGVKTTILRTFAATPAELEIIRDTAANDQIAIDLRERIAVLEDDNRALRAIVASQAQKLAER